LIGVRKVSIMMVDPETDELRIEAAAGIDQDIVDNAIMSKGEGIAGRVVREGTPLLVEDIEEDTRFGRANNDPIYGSKSFLCVPIRHGRDVIGVVNVSSPHTKEKLDDSDRRLLEVLVARISVGMTGLAEFADSSARYERIRDTFKAMLESRRYIDLSDDDTIVDIVDRTAERLGLDEEHRSLLRYTMHVYDLGLSRIGYHVVKRPQELSPKDRQEVQEHTKVGANMLGEIDERGDVRRVVRSHHENYDGSGYPDGLAGDDIPLEARVVRIADTLRALISSRPYQRRYLLDEAIEIIRHRSGTLFDEHVVNVFIEVIEEMEDQFSGGGDSRKESDADKREQVNNARKEE
jgi:response regulator RpfG family c-di-GMP phosphodiesterase